MKDKDLESNAEYQRRKMMSQDDRNMIARDIMAKNQHEQNVRDGKKTTYEEAQRQITEKIYREERKKKENGK